MRRLLAVGIIAAVGFGAAGCGTSPEDKARDAGKDIGEALYSLQTATSAEDAGKAIDEINARVGDIREKLPSGVRAEVVRIGEQLRADLDAAGQDPAKVRGAFQSAATELRGLSSDTDSVVNELRRGVREGYDDAAS